MGPSHVGTASWDGRESAIHHGLPPVERGPRCPSQELRKCKRNRNTSAPPAATGIQSGENAGAPGIVLSLPASQRILFDDIGIPCSSGDLRAARDQLLRAEMLTHYIASEQN